MIGTVLVTLCLPQDPDLAAVRADEARRVAVIERCARAVCSVMDMSSPGGGSGVIIDPAGLVLTNYHVVGQADTQKKQPANPLPGFGDDGPVLPEPPEPPAAELEQWQKEHPEAGDTGREAFVRDWQQRWREEHHPQGKHHYRHKKVGLPDGLLYEAVVLGIDPGSDLAVLRLLPKEPGQQWPWCEIGDSDQLLVGETVFAMGNPFLLATDFTPTVTFGIVSGTHRYQEGGGQRMLVYPDCIQVDAPVNPGNSGGPLFNEHGEVVGINGRISIGDRGRVNVGVGFAISSNQIKNFLGDLIAGRHAEHGTLDMSAWYMDAPQEDGSRRGVFVQQMFRDSVVAAAGVSLGDEITMFNGAQVRSANQLATMVGVLPAGSWVTLGYRPALDEGGYGEERELILRLAALDTGSSADAKADSERLASRHDRRIVTRSLLQRFRSDEPATDVDLTCAGPDGQTVRFRRQGEAVRLDLDGRAIVRGADGAWWTLREGAAGECTVEERARVERELATNPLLWAASERGRQLEQAMLAGGGQALGRPVLRFSHPGPVQLETWLSLAGGPAGYVLRDPLRKARVECHLDGDRVRMVVDGEVEPGWSIRGLAREPLDPALFRRP